MALNGSGPISLAGATAGESIAVELGESPTSAISLNDTIVRDLAEIASGAITMPTNFWGKSSVSPNLYVWGRSDSGQLGLDSTSRETSPVALGDQEIWSSMAAGSNHSLAAKSDGTLWSWGSGSAGKLGHNNTTYLSSPVQVGALTTWDKVFSGPTADNSFAIKTDGTLWAWGFNYFRALGVGDNTYRSSPTQIGGDTNWAKVSVGGNTNHAIKTDNTLYGWGENGNGVVGNGTSGGQVANPAQVTGSWLHVATGDSSAIGIKTNGTLWSWGFNSNGVLGLDLPSATRRSSPVQIGGDTNWAYVASGQDTAIAVKTDGTIWGWGNNTEGQIGDGTTISRSSPVQIGALTNWDEGDSGFDFTLWLKTDGSLWAWGENDQGHLGLGNLTRKSSPVQVGSLTTWTEVAGGREFSLGLFPLP